MRPHGFNRTCSLTTTSGLPISGGHMIRVNMDWWARIADALSSVAAIKDGTPFLEAYTTLVQAWPKVWSNYHDEALMRLIVSQQTALAFCTAATKLLENPSRTEPITVEEAGALHKAVNEYRPILYAELQSVDAYYVQQQGAFSTRTLIEKADSAIAISPELAQLVSDEVKSDLRESGRCLAFQLPTASGFHVARATETVIKALMAAAKCQEPKESQRNWGTYIKLLDDRQVDNRITHHLAMIKELHRNPLSHPDITLTMPDALALWSLCTSLIATMIAEISKLTPIATTTSA